MKKTKLLGFAAILIAFAALITPAFATDQRYLNYWTCDSNVEYSGNWNNWEIAHWHEAFTHTYFRNQYAPATCKKGGHYSISIDFYGDDLWVLRPHGDFYVKAYTQSNQTGSQYGMQLKVRTNPCNQSFPSDKIAWIWLQTLLGDNALPNRWTIDFETHFLRFRERIRISPDEPTASAMMAYRIETVRKSDNQVTVLLTIYSVTYSTSVIAAKTEYAYGVSAEWGTDGYNNYFWVHANIDTIGLHCDPIAEDWKCDLKDIFAVGNLFGETVGDRGYEVWFWGGNYWKCDIYADGIIDLKDYFYLSQWFGKNP